MCVRQAGCLLGSVGRSALLLLMGHELFITSSERLSINNEVAARQPAAPLMMSVRYMCSTPSSNKLGKPQGLHSSEQHGDGSSAQLKQGGPPLQGVTRLQTSPHSVIRFPFVPSLNIKEGRTCNSSQRKSYPPKRIKR